MADERFIVVWRDKPGVAVRALADDHDVPRVFGDDDKLPLEVVDDTSDFAAEWASREEFPPRRVDVQTAQSVLRFTLTHDTTTQE